jgi:chemotaxis protein CheX
MKEQHLKTFVSGVSGYFEHFTAQPAEVHAPYIDDQPPRLLDYTAVIGISGGYQGCVYFTAGTPLLQELLARAGETGAADADSLADAAGEVANTISGNARGELGAGFTISVPSRLRGQPADFTRPPSVPAFVIPISWQGHRSELVVCLR